MKDWTEIINEFLNGKEYDVWMTKYDDEPFLIIDASRYGDRFIEHFNEWFKGTNYYKHLEEYTVIRDYDTFFLDTLNVNYGYSDEYTMCFECGNAIRTGDNADNYWAMDGLILCESCTRENAECYIKEYLVYNYETGIPKEELHINKIFSETELESFGFKKYSKEYEVGFYGTYDDPYKILTEYVNETRNRNTDYIINMISSNPFATYYQIWKRNNDPGMTEEHKNLLYKMALEIAMESNIGSITKEEMRELHRQLDYAPYCERLGVAYEDLTEENEEEIFYMIAMDAGYDI